MGSSEVASGVMKVFAGSRELFMQHAAEAIRECAILWLVFAVLERAVSGTLTFPWAMSNFLGSVVFWVIGMYIEVKRQR